MVRVLKTLNRSKHSISGNKMAKYRHTTARQWGGDDGFQWAVFLKGKTTPVVSGLTRREVAYYRERIEKECEEEKRKQRELRTQ